MMLSFHHLGTNSIIYENGGFLYNFDIETQEATQIQITIAEDLASGRSEYKDASKFINSWAVSPDGKRISLGARGDVWTVPASKGITKNLTESSGVHDRNVEWSPDGKYISFISDRTGEDEIYIQEQDGKSEAIQITTKSENYKYNPIWSPDSKKLLWSDRSQVLQYIDIDTKEIVVVQESKTGVIRTYNWSPDSKWITYPMQQIDEETSRIWIYNVDTKETNPVTDSWYDSDSPSFSSNGDYLFFTSLRDFNPIYSWTEWNHAYRDMQNVYFVTLRKDVKNPFEPENDVVTITEEQKETTAEAETKEEKERQKRR